MLRFAMILILTAGTLPAAEPFIVHEWGVYVRSQITLRYNVGKGGLVGEQPSSTLLSAPDELITSLPDFVLRHANNFKPQTFHRDWDKPVIHFYGPEGLDVRVDVQTPQGHPLAYWPKPALKEETIWRMGSGHTAALGMSWSGTLCAEHPNPAKLEKAVEGHWWNALRNVPGKWLKTEGATERFVFYEASAAQNPTLEAAVSGHVLTLKNTAASDSGTVVVIVNDGATRHVYAVPHVPAQSSLPLQKTDVLAAAGEESALLQTCRKQWESFGMTAEEAHAIVEAWKPDLLNHPGILVLARVPADVYEKMFPLTIHPAPSQCVRAGVVFDHLPGNAERAAWLPGLSRLMEQWGAELGNESFEIRHRASTNLARCGDLAIGQLQALLKHKDIEVRTRAQQPLDALKPTDLAIPHYKESSEQAKARQQRSSTARPAALKEKTP